MLVQLWLRPFFLWFGNARGRRRLDLCHSSTEGIGSTDSSKAHAILYGLCIYV
jgi:hypothetical protein